MTALDDRIRGLAPPAETPTPIADLRLRASRHRSRRWAVTGVATLVTLLLVAVVVVARPSGTDPETIVAGPDDTRIDAPISFGGASGVGLTATPSSGLVDGQEVTVRVEGLEHLPGAELAMCRGDLTEPVGLDDCDLGALSSSRSATDEQVVVVSAAIHLDGRTGPYDCATEPAGCVLAVGTVGPVPSGVAVPVQFRPGTAPVPGDEQMTVDPSTGLAEGRAVSVSAAGLAPNRAYRVVQCAPAQEDPSSCAFDDDAFASSAIVADADGTITATSVVRAEVWSSWDGVVDCTVRRCHLQLMDDRFAPVALSSPLAFAPDVAATLPQLVLDPVGPYVDGQEVVVRGTGFVPGSVASGRVGQCPAGLDTRKEERCTYPQAFGGVEVAPDGTFELAIVLHESLLFTGSCRDGDGCVVGWVINHGPLVAPVPLTFR